MSIQILGADGVTVLSTINVGGAVGAVPAVAVRRDGSDVNQVFLGEYYISMAQRLNAAQPPNSGLFSMRNGGTRTIKFIEMQISMAFDGVAMVGEFNLAIQKTTSASATPAGGIALGGATGLLGAPAFGVVPESIGSAVSTLADARYATTAAPLTTAGIITTSPISSLTLAHSVTGTNLFINWGRDFELAPNEGLIISNMSAIVVGDSFSFTGYWGEF